MKKELEKNYNPQEIEGRLYEKWMGKKYFHAKIDRTKEPFSIVMPPPNITGQLHMGHALDNTLPDILIRFKRMQGYNVLWQPGTDHASIATEVKIIKALKAEGIDKNDLGREKFLERAWEWKQEYGGKIVEQLKKLGSSADWERERFTMDEGCSKAVLESFIHLYEKGWIYKGSKIINWCPVCKTSISDAEVEYEEQAGHFWHIKYPIVGTDRFVEIATTRPETMLGDTAVAVHPEDERYQDLIGKMVKLPIMDKEIPIIADSYVDREFGTGVVKITPAHDPNDFEVGKRHNLKEVTIMDDDATINEQGGKYAGLDRYEARKHIVRELDELGLLVKIEEHVHNVGTHDRCKTTVEPLVKQQWFVKMDELIKPAIEAVKNKEIQLIPERSEKTYFNWTDNIRDWCISRQLWWGHRIPAYYCECGEMVVSKEMPLSCPACGGSNWKQDEDCLDTWFSSALWPFSTLGWPEQTEELEYFYPTSVLVTGYDIIFFWVIRMIFSGYEYTKKPPFKKVLFHGLVRDSQGIKMSKSLGNGTDPLEVIDQYGADALRLSLILGNASGNDMRYYQERVESCRNFANKVWNASRFIMMNIDKADLSDLDDQQIKQSLTQADKWILSKGNALIKEVTENMENLDFGIAVQKVYDFIWEEFCDWFVEMVKPRLYNEEDTTKAVALWTLKKVLIDSLKLLHPYMPFITEEIFCTLQQEEESIMISSWPVYEQDSNYQEEEEAVELMKKAVKEIRNVRTSMNVPPSKKATVIVVSSNEKVRNIFENGKVFFATLGFASEVVVQADRNNIPEDAVSAVVPEATIYIPFAELIEVEKEIDRLEKEKQKLEIELKRSYGMLQNEKFMNKAPEIKIKEEKEKLKKYQNMMDQVVERLEHLKNLQSL